MDGKLYPAEFSGAGVKLTGDVHAERLKAFCVNHGIECGWDR